MCGNFQHKVSKSQNLVGHRKTRRDSTSPQIWDVDYQMNIWLDWSSSIPRHPLFGSAPSSSCDSYLWIYFRSLHDVMYFLIQELSGIFLLQRFSNLVGLVFQSGYCCSRHAFGYYWQSFHNYQLSWVSFFRLGSSFPSDLNLCQESRCQQVF